MHTFLTVSISCSEDLEAIFFSDSKFTGCLISCKYDSSNKSSSNAARSGWILFDSDKSSSTLSNQINKFYFCSKLICLLRPVVSSWMIISLQRLDSFLYSGSLTESINIRLKSTYLNQIFGLLKLGIQNQMRLMVL